MKKYIIPDNMCADKDEIRRVIACDPDNEFTMLSPSSTNVITDVIGENPESVITSSLHQVVECIHHGNKITLSIIRHNVVTPNESYTVYSLDN